MDESFKRNEEESFNSRPGSFKMGAPTFRGIAHIHTR